MSKYIPGEKLSVGDGFGPLELPFVERYFTCEMDELSTIHTGASPWGGPVYPAKYMGTLLGLRLIGSQREIELAFIKAVHQKQADHHPGRHSRER